MLLLTDRVETQPDHVLTGLLASAPQPKLTKEAVLAHFKSLPRLPADWYVPIAADVGSAFCDGTKQRYDEWRQVVAACMKDPQVSDSIKQALIYVD